MSTVLDKNIQFEQVGKVMLKYHVCTLNNVRENRRAQQKWTIHGHKQHWAKDTERRQNKKHHTKS